MDPRQASKIPPSHSRGQPSDHRGGQCAPAHLDEQPVETGGRRAVVLDQRIDHLPGQGPAAVDGGGSLGSLAGEGNRASLDSGKHRMVGRVAGHARLALAAHHPAAELGDAVHHRFVGPGRHEHVEGPAHGSGHDRRGQRSVAAAGDGVGPVVPFVVVLAGQPMGEGHTEQVAGLVRAGHVARLVLDPQLRPTHAGGLGQLGPGAEGCRLEAVPFDTGDGRVKLADCGCDRFWGRSTGLGEPARL